MHPKTPTALRLAVAALVAVGAASLAPTAAAHEDTNHGTIKVHDSLTVSPATLTQPHVCGDFWIEGFAMAGGSGQIAIFSMPPTGDGTEVLSAAWAGELQEDGKFHFLAGPFNLSLIGHFRVEVYLDQGHPGVNTEHFAKVKLFWIDCLPAPIALPCPPGLQVVANANGSIQLNFAAAANLDLGVAAQVAAELQAAVDAQLALALAATLEAEASAEAAADASANASAESDANGTAAAEGDGSADGALDGAADAAAQVTATIEAAVEAAVALNATGMNIYRAEAGGEFELIATVGAGVTSYLDLNTTVGATYTYMVTVLVGNFESTGCEVVEVTPIPDFPTPLAIGLASAGGALAYIGLRRRK